MNSPLILVESQGPHIMMLTLNRPEKRNALTISLMEELCAAIDRAAKDEACRILILRGAGDVFCAGLDLKEASQSDPTHASAKMVARTLLTISQTPLMTIAAVHGAAVAGGAGLMSACDFVVAASDVKIGYPEVRRGLVAALVLTFLMRQLKERQVRELLFTAELISAEQALKWGLVNRVTAPGEVLTEVRKLTDSLLQGSPQALKQTKQLIAHQGASSVQEDLEKLLAHHLEARDSTDAREGIAAFLEKRPPSWIPKI